MNFDLNHGLALLIVVLHGIWTFTCDVREDSKIRRMAFMPFLVSFLLFCLIEASTEPVASVYYVLLTLSCIAAVIGGALVAYLLAYKASH